LRIYPINEKNSSPEQEDPIESDELMDDEEEWEWPIYYCPKCGRTYDLERKCRICSTQMIKMPYEYSKDYGRMDLDIWKKRVYEGLVIPSPEFDQYYFDHRDEITAELDRKSSKLLDKTNKPKCPTCGSYDVYKLTNTSYFDFRTYGCKNCGHKW
jgi:predicted RNA-binding Zn-ribbon protein involved in translation (DUF1610 family)